MHPAYLLAFGCLIAVVGIVIQVGRIIRFAWLDWARKRTSSQDQGERQNQDSGTLNTNGESNV